MKSVEFIYDIIGSIAIGFVGIYFEMPVIYICLAAFVFGFFNAMIHDKRSE